MAGFSVPEGIGGVSVEDLITGSRSPGARLMVSRGEFDEDNSGDGDRESGGEETGLIGGEPSNKEASSSVWWEMEFGLDGKIGDEEGDCGDGGGDSELAEEELCEIVEVEADGLCKAGVTDVEGARDL